VADDHPTLVVGFPQREHVRVTVLGRMHSGATDRRDGNWLISPISVSIGGFDGRVHAGLRADELKIFRDQLQVINARLEGTAELWSMEGWLRLDVSVRSTGALEVAGEVMDRPGIGNRLRFWIEGLDQSFLAAMIADLLTIEQAFPVFTAE
jgi:hypothetical protein